MPTPLTTSNDTFQRRLLRSERWRALLLAIVWLIAIVSVLMRRALGATIMEVDAIFFSTVGVLTLGIAFEGAVVFDVQRRLGRDRGQLRERPLGWVITALVDLAIPITVLWILQLFSPESRISSLTAPVLLGLPLVIMLSILRLRPWISFGTGLVAAVAHWSLVAYTIRVGEVDPHQWPVLFTYGELLVLTGIVAAVIASQCRAYVREAVDEAVTAEKVQRELAAVDHDLSVARQIQRSLMPATPPTLAGFDIAGMARPAQQTGGDYYDWQQLSDGRLAVAVADVTGHGIGPALVMAVCRAYARASAPAALDPTGLLNRINALIYDDLSTTGRFITMVIAMISPDGVVELISAGHGPTLLFKAQSGEVEWFGGDGPPLGVDAAARYEPLRKLHLETGDAILLLTDGFMEWARASDGELFGIDRLKETMRDAARESGSAQAMLDRLDAAVQEFADGAAQMDDTTAVAIRRTG